MSLSSFLAGPFTYWQAAVRSPRSRLFSRLNSPNSLSLSSQQRGSSPQIIFVASSGPSPAGPCLSCAWGLQSRMQDYQGVSEERSRGAESPPLPCCPCCWGCSPGYSQSSGLQAQKVVFVVKQMAMSLRWSKQRVNMFLHDQIKNRNLKA